MTARRTAFRAALAATLAAGLATGLGACGRGAERGPGGGSSGAAAGDSSGAAAGDSSGIAAAPPDSVRAEPGAGDECAGRRVPPVTSRGIGVAALGTRMSELARRCPVRDTALTLGEGTMERASVISFGGHDVVALTTGTADTSIIRVIARDDAFRTAGGTGVGSTVAELRRAHGPLRQGAGEGRIALWSDRLPGVSFGLGPGLRAPADTSRVVEVWVWGGGGASGKR